MSIQFEKWRCVPDNQQSCSSRPGLQNEQEAWKGVGGACQPDICMSWVLLQFILNFRFSLVVNLTLPT